jgi:hypothetical protein
MVESIDGILDWFSVAQYTRHPENQLPFFEVRIYGFLSIIENI